MNGTKQHPTVVIALTDCPHCHYHELAMNDLSTASRAYVSAHLSQLMSNNIVTKYYKEQ